MNMQPNADFLRRLDAIFLVEAREHVQALGAGLIDLQKAAHREHQLPIIETLFRETHSLKGAARSVDDAGAIERLCQTLENAFSNLKSGQRTLSPEALDGLHRDAAVLGQLIDTFATKPSLSSPAPVAFVPPQPPRQARTVTAGPVAGEAPGEPGAPVTSPPSTRATAPARGNGPDTVRVATSKLDAIFVQVEELVGVKLAQAERTAELRALACLVAERDHLRVATLPLIRSLRQQVAAKQVADVSALQERLLTHLDQDFERSETISVCVADLARAMTGDQRRFAALADRLLVDVKTALMLPFSLILAGFPKMIHDLARDIGKEIAFDMLGTDIETDKRILETVKDPLLHLVRNSVDHGIESPAERRRQGKTACGMITLSITQSGGKVEIVIADDGAGIDVEAVKAMAVRTGILAADEAATLSDQAARHLVFRSGVTTGVEVTTVSGRGLGMAIVQENVAKVGGLVSIDSVAGTGTTVRIVIPLTLATLRGTLVSEGNREFVIPTINVARVVRLERSAIRRVENRDSFCLDGATLALVRLADVLGLPARPGAGISPGRLTVLVLEHAQGRIGFTVDQVIDEQEVLAKPLGRLLPRVRNLAGATLLGMGRVVPILSVPDLLQTASGRTQVTSAPGVPEEAVRIKRLLVADDSITVRTLLQNILEAAGYMVKTAPDGAVAFTMLRNESFDLVVTDVEMPRLNGFELTKRIRADPRLAALPVVLVTGREAKDDRERGLAAGAHAYIVKSDFEQSNLLEAIGRLI